MSSCFHLEKGRQCFCIQGYFGTHAGKDFVRVEQVLDQKYGEREGYDILSKSIMNNVKIICFVKYQGYKIFESYNLK